MIFARLVSVLLVLTLVNESMLANVPKKPRTREPEPSVDLHLLTLVETIHAKLETWDNRLGLLENQVSNAQERLQQNIDDSMQKQVSDSQERLRQNLEDAMQKQVSSMEERLGNQVLAIETRVSNDVSCIKDKLSDTEEKLRLEMANLKVCPDYNVFTITSELAQFGKTVSEDMLSSGEKQALLLKKVSENIVSNLSAVGDQFLQRIVSEFEILNETMHTGFSNECNVTREIDDSDLEKLAYEMCREGMDALPPKYPYPYPVVYFKFGNGDEKQLLCDTTTSAGGWILIQRRVRGDTKFYRGWEDYKRGFGSLNEDFWIGLDTIHNLTNHGAHTCELRVDMKYKGVSKFAHYSKFHVAGEADNYRLSLGSYDGTAGDSLARHNHMMFSTKDRDNDIYDENNCAVRYMGGWWYDKCHESNLNGLWGDESYGKGLTWRAWTDYYGSVELSEMKVRCHDV